MPIFTYVLGGDKQGYNLKGVFFYSILCVPDVWKIDF